MSSDPGVITTTKLIRRAPFAEWTLIYFDPKKTTPQKLLRQVQAANCPRATIDVIKDSPALNPYLAGGDTLILPAKLSELTTLNAAELPEGWETDIGSTFRTGMNEITVRVPQAAVMGRHEGKLTFENGQSVSFVAEIVRRVP